MELQLGSSRVEFLVKAHSTHNVKWVSTPLVIHIFERNSLGVDELAQVLHFRCPFAPAVLLLFLSPFSHLIASLAESLHPQFCHLIFFSFLNTYYLIHSTYITQRTEKQSLDGMGKQTQNELQSTQRPYLCQGHTINIYYSINRKC